MKNTAPLKDRIKHYREEATTDAFRCALLNDMADEIDRLEAEAEVLKASNARAHECSEREKARANGLKSSLDACHDGYLKVRKERDELGLWQHNALARVRELEAIVDSLPKTADGVPITPGMEVWPDCQIDEGPGKVEFQIDDPSCSDPIESSDIVLEHVYSTRAAAEAAKGSK